MKFDLSDLTVMRFGAHGEFENKSFSPGTFNSGDSKSHSDTHEIEKK